jgi:hypothetical protein
MSELLNLSSPADKAQEAEAVLTFVTRYVEIHRKPPTLRECCDGTMLNDYRVKRAIKRLRRENRISQTALRPMQKATQIRFAKQAKGVDAAD